MRSNYSVQAGLQKYLGCWKLQNYANIPRLYMTFIHVYVENFKMNDRTNIY